MTWNIDDNVSIKRFTEDLLQYQRHTSNFFIADGFKLKLMSNLDLLLCHHMKAISKCQKWVERLKCYGKVMLYKHST